MANMWLWFQNPGERLEFVKKMLNLKPHQPQGRSKQAREEAAWRNEEWEIHLDTLNDGKTKSAWYSLEKTFYLANLRDYSTRAEYERLVWDKGFRRIYTVRSYYYRPGYWLVLKFRYSRQGAAMRTWVQENFPESKMGTRVPVPPEQMGVFGLWAAREILGSIRRKPEDAGGRLARAQELLEEAFTLCPKKYRREEYQQLWDELARRWEDFDHLDRVEYCYKKMTQFDQRRPEPWLNLGFFYQRQEMEKEAVEAYRQGLANNYCEPHLIYNLAALWGGVGKDHKALGLLAEALFERPGLNNYANLKLFADLSMKVREYSAASICYNRAVYDAPEDWPEARECLQNMAHCLVKMGEPRKALVELERAMVLEEHPDTILQYAQTLGYGCRQWSEALVWTERYLDFHPDNKEAKDFAAALRARKGNKPTVPSPQSPPLN